MNQWNIVPAEYYCMVESKRVSLITADDLDLISMDGFHRRDTQLKLFRKYRQAKVD